MRKKLFTYITLGALVFSSFAFVYSPLDNSIPEPLAAATPGIVDVEDRLYYHFMELEYDEMADEERWDDGIAMLEVIYAEVGENITYDLYMQSETTDGWEWLLAPPEDQGESDDYSYEAYMHRFTVSPSLSSMVDANASDNIDALFLADTGLDTMTSSYSSSGDHRIELRMNQ